ncbi:MAG: hypothetical protein ACR2G6_12640 [Gemmatimonadaceae bacterium]
MPTIARAEKSLRQRSRCCDRSKGRCVLGEVVSFAFIPFGTVGRQTHSIQGKHRRSFGERASAGDVAIRSGLVSNASRVPAILSRNVAISFLVREIMRRISRPHDEPLARITGPPIQP